MRTELRQALEQVARRFRQVRLWSGLALCWLVWSLSAWASSPSASRSGSAPIPRELLMPVPLALAASAIVCAILALRSARDPRWVARRIEAKHPELGTGLLAAVEQDDPRPRAGSGSCRPPSSAKPWNTTSRTTGRKRSRRGRSAARK